MVINNFCVLLILLQGSLTITEINCMATQTNKTETATASSNATLGFNTTTIQKNMTEQHSSNQSMVPLETKSKAIPANTTEQYSSSNPKNNSTFSKNPKAESTKNVKLNQSIVPLETTTEAKVTIKSKASTPSNTTKGIEKTSNINSNNTMSTIESRSASSKSSYQATGNIMGSILTFVAVITIIY